MTENSEQLVRDEQGYRCDCGCPIVRVRETDDGALSLECPRCEEPIATARDIEWEVDR